MYGSRLTSAVRITPYLDLWIDGIPRGDVFQHDVSNIVDNTARLKDVAVDEPITQRELHSTVSTTRTAMFDERLW